MSEYVQVYIPQCVRVFVCTSIDDIEIDNIDIDDGDRDDRDSSRDDRGREIDEIETEEEIKIE